MEHKQVVDAGRIEPRIVIHGGAGNIVRNNLPQEKYQAYRYALLTIIARTSELMHARSEKSGPCTPGQQRHLSSALDVATYAVSLLEDNPLFNSARGAVFTRDGINELEASVMVSRGHKKRGVGVMGLRHVRNPILLAKFILEHGEQDLGAGVQPSSHVRTQSDLDVPSAQGHTQLWGPAAEQLARQYGLEMVDPNYYFTQQRWDEHVRALKGEEAGCLGSGTWDPETYLPQGTVGAVALDEMGVICAATSTGGMTNKLTGRIGDTPCVGAGFWAEEWSEDGKADCSAWSWSKLVRCARPGLSLTSTLRGLLADCLPTPLTYSPTDQLVDSSSTTHITRCLGVSGTGNGDSFLRTSAARTVAAMARYKPESAAQACSQVVGPKGELQRSAGDRWGRTGEGEGGMIGIECLVERDATGSLVRVRSEVIMDYNCGGMFRAWMDEEGRSRMSIWNNGGED